MKYLCASLSLLWAACLAETPSALSVFEDRLLSEAEMSPAGGSRSPEDALFPEDSGTFRILRVAVT